MVFDVRDKIAAALELETLFTPRQPEFGFNNSWIISPAFGFRSLR
jgi:hypothetical protein